MNDLEIAKSVDPRPIAAIAAQLGVREHQLEPYGRDKAKLPLDLIDEERAARAALVLVTGISPTPAGEGKTTVSIGLTQAMQRRGKRTTAVLREPSLGPVFGIKGGAAGGGHSQVIPMEAINLHFTGDFAAVEKAHNLLAALIDNALLPRAGDTHHPAMDARTVLWKRVMDMNDRALRGLIVGLGGAGHGVPRESGFDITAASEVMAILCMASGLPDLKRRLGNILVGFTRDKQPVYARDLKAAGAMTALMTEAIKPNLVQTLEGTPAIVHGGPFANIAQGTNTVIATRMGLSLSDYVVTEAGFGADLGAEKFLDIKCASSGLAPRVVVVVATVRALKYHGGVALSDLERPDPAGLRRGLPNLEKHLENMRAFGLPPVVALNRFTSDTDEEVDVVVERCRELGITAVPVEVWAKGGEGALELADVVADLAAGPAPDFRPLYSWEQPPTDKIETICRRIYGAAAVEYSPAARKQLARLADLGLEGLPICMAKTQKSLSDDPDLLGRPEGFTLRIREIEIAAGAGFIIPIAGDMMRMPGLPGTPAAEAIDVDDAGNISGLF